MSKKFEQLLDYLVNEEMDKANELFHEIVVEKSREIYENMIAQEAEEDDEEVDESAEEDDEELDEASDEDDEEVDESYEDEETDESYMDADETTLEIGGDAGDDMLDKTMDPMAGDMGGDMGGDMSGDMGGDMGGDMSSGEEQILDIVSQLRAEFADLVAKIDGEEGGDDMDMDMDSDAPDFGGDDDESDDTEEKPTDEDLMMGIAEGRRLREYKDKVSDGHGVEKKGKAEEGDGKAGPVSSAKGRPTTTASAHNILQNKTDPEHKAGVGGLLKKGGDFVKSGTHNVNGVKSGVKTLSKVPAGHGAEKKGSGEQAANTKSLLDKAQ